MDSIKSQYKFNRIYFFLFFGFGAVLPLISLYLESIGFDGVQIGTTTALGSLVSIFAGPFWGFISDRYHAHKQVIFGLLIALFTCVLLITTTTSYHLILVIYFFYNIASAPINPMLDVFVLHSKKPYGAIRLWGAIGFAISAFATAYVAQKTGLVFIFYIFAVCIVIVILQLKHLTISITKAEPVNFKHLVDLLTTKKFLIFITYSFLLTSTIAGNNVYFGLYFKSIGGPITLVGLAFFLFALSEAPFMGLAAKKLPTTGPYIMLALAPFLGAFRWLLYGLIPHPALILGTFFLQGLFYGPFLVGSAEYIRLEIPKSLHTTAMALNVAISFGFGGFISNFSSGFLYSHLPATWIYVSYAALCGLGLIFVPYLYKNRTFQP